MYNRTLTDKEVINTFFNIIPPRPLLLISGSYIIDNKFISLIDSSKAKNNNGVKTISTAPYFIVMKPESKADQLIHFIVHREYNLIIDETKVKALSRN